MTETYDSDVIAEALMVIDRALGEMLHRELVSTDEVADLLLDVRSLLTSPTGRSATERRRAVSRSTAALPPLPAPLARAPGCRHLVEGVDHEVAQQRRAR